MEGDGSDEEDDKPPMIHHNHKVTIYHQYDNEMPLVGYFITWILHKIFLFSNKVKLAVS